MYVVVSVGETWRSPRALTVPIPGAIETSVASLTDQRKLADWPRSMVPGSTENCRAGLGGGGGVGVGVAGGGGGGGAGTGFLQPAANRIKETESNTALIFRLVIVNCLLEVDLVLHLVATCPTQAGC